MPRLIGVAIVALLFAHDVMMATPTAAATMGAARMIAAGQGAATRDRHDGHQTTPHPAGCGVGQTWAPAPLGVHVAPTATSLGAWMGSLQPAPRLVASDPPPWPPQVARAFLQVYRL